MCRLCGQFMSTEDNLQMLDHIKANHPGTQAYDRIALGLSSPAYICAKFVINNKKWHFFYSYILQTNHDVTHLIESYATT